MSKFNTYFAMIGLFLLSAILVAAILFDFSNDDVRYVVAQDMVCGDGVVDLDEECDDGNTYNDDGCTSTCKNEIVRIAPKAGPGLLLIFLAIVVGAGVSGVYYAYKKGFLKNEKLY